MDRLKRVLLHLAAVLGLALVCVSFMAYWPTVSTSGFMGRWKASILYSGAYLLALLGFFLAMRGLKKRACKGLWIYSLPSFLLIGLYLYGSLGQGYGEVTSSTIKNVPYTVFFLLPSLLIPLMPAAEERKGTLPAIALFAVLAVAFGSMTVGWYLNTDWTRRELFDPMDQANRTFISDAYKESSSGLLLTVDGEGRMYAYVSRAEPKKDIGYRRQPTVIFSVRREGNEFVFYKDFYEDENPDQPVFSIPCMRGHIWYNRETDYAYVASMSYEDNPLFTNSELGYLYCRLENTDLHDVGTDDILAGRRPEDWPGVAWDLLDQHFIVGDDHTLTNDRDMALLWTYTDDCFILAKRKEGPDGVTYEPWACGRKQAGRGVYEVKNMGTGVWWNGMDDFVYTDYDSQNRGVIWPGEPLKDVREARLKDGWQEVPLRDEYASSLCLLEKDGRRCLLFHGEANASAWADWSEDMDYEGGEHLIGAYALLASDGTVEAYGGLALVAADRIEPLLAKLDTRSRIGSFGYIDWQACWPPRARLTADGRLILRNQAGEWTVMALEEIIGK